MEVDNDYITELVEHMDDDFLKNLRKHNAMTRDMYEDNYLNMKRIVDIMDREIEKRAIQ